MNNDMINYRELADKMIDLESKIAFQEHTIQELNEVVTQQQTEIMAFKSHLKRLTDQLENQSTSSEEAPSHEPPPHY